MSCGRSLFCDVTYGIGHTAISMCTALVDLKMTQSDRYLEELDERLLKYALRACPFERRLLWCISSMVQPLQVRNQDLLSPHQQRKALHMATFLAMHATDNCHSKLLLQYIVIMHTKCQ